MSEIDTDNNCQSIQYTSGWFTTELGVDHHITLTRVGPYDEKKFQRFIDFVAQNIPDEVYFKVIGELEKGKKNPRRRKAHVKLMFSKNEDTDNEVRRVFDRLLKEFSVKETNNINYNSFNKKQFHITFYNDEDDKKYQYFDSYVKNKKIFKASRLFLKLESLSGNDDISFKKMEEKTRIVDKTLIYKYLN